MPDHVLTPSRALSFGTFAAAYEGSITISPEGARTGTGGVVPVAQVLGTPGELRLVSVYEKGVGALRVTMPPQVTLRNTGPSSGEMVANRFTWRTSAPRPFGVDRVVRDITVGATLHVGAQQAPGRYEGVFPTIVEYE